MSFTQPQIRVVLPWPPKDLHPNARVHWAKRAKAAKKSRGEAWALTRLVEGRTLRIFDNTVRVPVSLTFCPPDRRKRDIDGMLSACKSQLDGFAEALMVNDNLFDLTLKRGELVKGGKVIVEVL
jgi:crossover junction endodeoxyribonuclease RusA